MSESSNRSSSGSKNLRPLLVAAACALCLAFGVVVFRSLAAMREGPSQKDSRERGLYARVRLAKPGKQTAPLQGFGTVRPKRRVALSAELSAPVIEVHPRLKVGEAIKAGETLIVLDRARLELRRESCESRKALLAARREALEEECGSLGAMRVHCEELLSVANDEVSRLQKLIERGVGTASGLDGARQQALGLKTQLVSVKGQLAALGPRRSELAAQERGLEVEAREIQLDLSRATIVAPFDALIESVSVEAGDYAVLGRPLLSLVDLQCFEIPVSLTGEQLAELAPAALESGSELAAVRVSWLDGGQSRQEWTGRIARIEDIDARTRTFVLVVEVQKPWGDEPVKKPLMRPGMFCELALPGRDYDNACLVDRLLVEDGLMKVERQGRLDFVEVEVLRTLPQGRALIRGLEPEDRIVVSVVPVPVRGLLLEPQLEEP